MPPDPLAAFGDPDDPAIATHMAYLRQTLPWQWLAAIACGLTSALMLAVTVGMAVI